MGDSLVKLLRTLGLVLEHCMGFLVRLTTGTKVGDACLNSGGERRRGGGGTVGYCPFSEAFVSEVERSFFLSDLEIWVFAYAIMFLHYRF